MKLAVMQPYFFPYVGYFQLMKAADKWVVFDDTQFIDKGWINRNRVLHPDAQKEWQYITVPLSSRGQFDKICEISIDEKNDWRSEILGKLTAYKKKAPFYEQTTKFVRECLEVDATNLSKFVTLTLRKTAEVLQIDTPFLVQSEMGLELGEIEHSGQWALRIAERMKASEYLNPHGGAQIFNEGEFERAGIQLRFLRPRLRPYVQRRGAFVPGLSIIDVMMWNSIEVIRETIDVDFDLLEKSELMQ